MMEPRLEVARMQRFRTFETVFTLLLPALKNAEFTADEIEQLTVANPARAFSMDVRKV
jgi:predicted metal-dependent phosphotriesterase family hydrolase